MDIRQGIIEAANALGISPNDLATAISYETGGTFNPTQGGPTTKWGKHRGFIQFGEPQARRYGIDFSSPETAMATQLGANGGVVKYLRDTGVRPGMSLLDVYSAINAGGVGRYNASDTAAGGAPGNVRDKVASMGGHKAKAAALLGGNFTPDATAFNAPASADEDIPLVPSRERTLADDFADAYDGSSGGRRSGGDSGGLIYSPLDTNDAPLPEFDFVSANAEPEGQVQPAVATAPLADSPPLADLFKVKDFGRAGRIDPATGLPVLPRGSRAYG